MRASGNLRGKAQRGGWPGSRYIPTKGWSEIDVEGKPFYAPEAIAAFTQTLKVNLRDDIPVTEIDADINDPAFANTTAQALLDMLKVKK